MRFVESGDAMVDKVYGVVRYKAVRCVDYGLIDSGVSLAEAVGVWIDSLKRIERNIKRDKEFESRRIKRYGD